MRQNEIHRDQSWLFGAWAESHLKTILRVDSFREKFPTATSKTMEQSGVFGFIPRRTATPSKSSLLNAGTALAECKDALDGLSKAVVAQNSAQDWETV